MQLQVSIRIIYIIRPEVVKCQENEIKEAFNFVRGQDQGESPKGKTYWRKL